MIPELNPIEAPDLVCTACSKVMRREVVARHNGKLDQILYHCDSDGCRYTKTATLEHKNALNAKYVPLVPKIFRTPAYIATGQAHVVEVTTTPTLPVPSVIISGDSVVDAVVIEGIVEEVAQEIAEESVPSGTEDE